MFTGGLFTQYFLRDGIRQVEAYRTLERDAVEAARALLAEIWLRFAVMPSASEAETEDEFIYPVLRTLGWEWLVQPIADRRRRDVADALLFLTPTAKAAAQALPPLSRFALGVVIVENEARTTNLDRAPSAREAPASQILRYMSRAETQSNGTLQWGLLTNGGTWRMYYGRVQSRSEGFVGINLADLLNPPPLAPASIPDGAPLDHWMRVFLLLFRREAFEARGPGATTFLDTAMEEGRTYVARVTEELSAAVFDRVFRLWSRHSRDTTQTPTSRVLRGVPQHVREQYGFCTGCCSYFMLKIVTCCQYAIPVILDIVYARCAPTPRTFWTMA